MTRDDLVKVGMASGLTYREARKVVSTIIEEMKLALLRGETLHLPFLEIYPIRNKRPIRLLRLKRIVVMHKKRFRFRTRQKPPWK